MKVDGSVVKPSYRLKGGESVEMEVASLDSDKPIAQDIPLSVGYEDGDILMEISVSIRQRQQSKSHDITLGHTDQSDTP